MNVFLFFLLLLLISALYFCLNGYYQNRQLAVEHYSYNHSAFPTDLIGLKILHLSDVHFPRLKIPLTKIISLAKKSQPDLIILTGDTIDRIENVQQTRLPILLNQLTKIAPTYVIAGNHETSSGQLPEWEALLRTTSVVYLKDQVTFFEKGQGQVALVGLFDLSTNLSEATKERIKEADSTLLLAHRPEKIQEYLTNFSTDKPLAIFSGHAHGGQVRLPLIGGLYAPQQGLFPKYTAGQHFFTDFPNTQFFISRGLSNSKFPFRFNNTPVALIITVTNDSHGLR